MMYDCPMSLVGFNEIEFFVRCEILLVDGKTLCTLLYFFMFSILDSSILSSLYDSFLDDYLGNIKY
jgi:hypothetical protein